MSPYTQQHRAFRVATPLGTDVLLLQRFEGAEGVSRPFEYTLDLLSEDEQVDPEQLLRKPVIVTVVLPEGERKIHGLARRFRQLGQKDELTRYQAEIVPWLWFLGLSQDCRIFQNKSVLDIAREVFDGRGYTDYEFRCTQSYAPREYCVQYRESDLNFVSRLFEEEGIFYFFEHTDDKHLLVVADDNSAAQPCPGQETARMATDEGPFQDEDVLKDLRVESAVRIGQVTLRDYDFTRPSLSLQSSAAGDGREEIYDYPGRYVDLSDGDRYAQILLEEGHRDRKMVAGGGTCRAFRSGYRFTLEEHYRADANQAYLLVEVQHHAEVGDYRSWDTAPLQYRNTFVAIPFSTPYRPPLRAHRPRIHGSQTALVVGKSGEEIFTDSYGRVKVQFYWDRQGKKDDNSSCWIRVSYPWAGKAWGAVHIPRIGQEVIVEFLEGDPDRPIITGRVYNAEQTVPYGLPDNKTQSGIKSRSSKGGGTANFNEIRMEDRKGSEQLYIHAEKDKKVVVENDRNESVGHDETIDIGNDRTEKVGHDEEISIGNDRAERVNQDERVNVGRDRSHAIGRDESLRVGRNRNALVEADETIEIVGDRRSKIGKNDELQVGKKLLVKAGDQIVLQTGSASITMKKDGTIVIKGKDITVTGSGKINAKASGPITMKGSQIKQN